MAKTRERLRKSRVKAKRRNPRKARARRLQVVEMTREMTSRSLKSGPARSFRSLTSSTRTTTQFGLIKMRVRTTCRTLIETWFMMKCFQLLKANSRIESMRPSRLNLRI